MKKWKYLKGDENDFVGAPEWCKYVMIFDSKKVFEEERPPVIGVSRYQTEHADTETWDMHTVDGGKIIAQRQLIEDGEQVLNDCIGAPEAMFNAGAAPTEEIRDVNFSLLFKEAMQGSSERLSAINAEDVQIFSKATEDALRGNSPTIHSLTESLIAERGNRYGKFKDGAAIMQELKFVMREVDGWHHLTPSQKEALDMIQHKVGRILNGDPNYDDSWKDIAGYATLIVNELNGEVK